MSAARIPAVILLEREWLTIDEVIQLTGLTYKAIESRIYSGALISRNPRRNREVSTESLLSILEAFDTVVRAPLAESVLADRLLLSIEEAAEITETKKLALYQRAHRGALPHVRLGARAFVLAADVERVASMGRGVRELLRDDRGESSILHQLSAVISVLTTTALAGTVAIIAFGGVAFTQQSHAQTETLIASTALDRDFRLSDDIDVRNSTEFTLVDLDYRTPDSDPSDPRVCRQSTWQLVPSPSETTSLQLVNEIEIFPSCEGGWLPTSSNERVVLSAVEAGSTFRYENVGGRAITFTDGVPRTPTALQRWFILAFGGHDSWWTDDEVIDPVVRVVRMEMIASSPMTGGIDASVVGAVPVALEMLEHPTGNDDVVYTTSYQTLYELP